MLDAESYMEDTNTITREKALRNIAEWLFVNSKPLLKDKEWREKLLEVIEWNISKMK